jgi:hypothetical protein
MGWLDKLLSRSDNTSTADALPLPTVLQEGMAWLQETPIAVPDWPAVATYAEENQLDTNAFWSSAAHTWLNKVAQQFPSRYQVRASQNFLLLSGEDARAAKVVLEYSEKTVKRIKGVLEGIAEDGGFGHHVILMLDNDDDYYSYVSEYDSGSGEVSRSGGMFINHGYGHMVFTRAEMLTVQNTLAHELTHAMVRHLALPAWVNEGIAVNTEYRLAGNPGSLYRADEMHEKHATFWDAAKVQEFWSGKSWLRADDGNMLSYDLARTIVGALAQDYPKFVRFANTCDYQDGGAAALRAVYDVPPSALIAAKIGEGDWEPQPDTWDDGVEKGQFAPPLR